MKIIIGTSDYLLRWEVETQDLEVNPMISRLNPREYLMMLVFNPFLRNYS